MHGVLGKSCPRAEALLSKQLQAFMVDPSVRRYVDGKCIGKISQMSSLNLKFLCT